MNHFENCESKDNFEESCRNKESLKLNSDSKGLEQQFNSLYQPMDYSEIQKFKDVKLIYDLPLAPCKVYTVSEEGSDKLFVKKVINKEVLNDASKAMARHECVVQSQMEHPNIIKLHKFSESEKTIELIMDHCSQGSYFEDRLEESMDPIEDMELLKKYAREALSALEYIHSRGLIHCDIKLANMGLHKESEDSEEVLKIFDFGLGIRSEPELCGKAHIECSKGTFGYMAPEMKGRDILIGPEIDIWALGICLYKMCVGYAPGQIRRYQYGSGPIPFGKRDWRKIDPKFQDLISKCLEYEHEQRISASSALSHKALN